MIERSTVFDFVTYAAMILGMFLVLVPFWITIVAGSEQTSSSASNLTQGGRIAQLEEEVAALRGEMEDLKGQFEAFRQQFQ